MCILARVRSPAPGGRFVESGFVARLRLASGDSMPVQARRLLVLFAVAIGGFLVVRHFLLPESFGMYGHYRAKAVDFVASQPLEYAGHLACSDCHEEVAALKSASKHAVVACEACHGPAASHASDPTESKPQRPTERKHCGLCHYYEASRPAGFPQIDPADHGDQERCVSCHNPHSPGITLEGE